MKEIEQLNAGVQRLERLVRRLESTAAEPEQIEIDLLLQELRTLYSAALALSAPTATVPSQPEAAKTTEAPVPESAETPAEPEPVVVAPPMQPHHVVAPEDAVDDPEVEAQPLMQPLEESETNTLFDAPETTEPEPEVGDHQWSQPEPITAQEPIIVEAPAPEEKPEPFNPQTFQPKVGDRQWSQPEPEPKVGAPQWSQPSNAPTLNSTPSNPPRQSSLFDYIRSSNQAQQEGPATLGDRIGRGGNELRGETAQHKRVSDLRTVININDKFSFMKDLFQNNMKAYNDFIVELNNIEDRATAQRRVDEVAQLYNWDKGSLTVKTFYNIFDRKF